MSGPPPAKADPGPWSRLPERLQPRSRELPGSGSQRLVETTLLLLVGLLLAIATVNDVVRQTGVNHRLIADLSTWRGYTGHYYRNVGVDEELLGSTTHRDVVCGNTTPGAPKARVQICLVMTGPIHGGRRRVSGGFYLPPKTENNLRAYRYGCFGSVTKGLCAR
jgi:hypothetical protein